MRDYIEERVIQISKFIIEKNATVRAAAKHFNISKSTVHKDVSERLFIINPALGSQVQIVLKLNKKERHLRGGEATKRKYEQLNVG